MTTKYRIYRPDGTVTEGQVDWPDMPGYDQLKKLITPVLDGGDLERVRVLHSFDGRAAGYTDMFVDEVGQIKGLPVNREATKIYRHNWLTQNPSTNPDSMPFVYGPAIVFDRPVWF